MIARGLAAAVLAALAAPATAAVVASADFNAGNGDMYTYSYGGGPDAAWNAINYSMPPAVLTNVAGVANATWNWSVPTPDPSGAGYNQMWWAGGGMGSWADLDSGVNTADMSQWTFSIDLRTPAGMTGASKNVTLQVQFHDGGVEPWPLVLERTVAIDGSWQTFSSSLSTWTATVGSTAQLQAELDAHTVGGIVFQVGFDSSGFGYDAGNTVELDNFVMGAPVPEPTALLGLGVASLGLMIRRRQK